jgi:hypothetical protein
MVGRQIPPTTRVEGIWQDRGAIQAHHPPGRYLTG